MTARLRPKKITSTDHELRVGALAHYEDPTYYAHNYRRRAEDIAYYTHLAEHAGGPVLEYGIGNGRIAIPMARAGATVFGIDHSKPMLADLEARLARESKDVRARVKARFGDMRYAKLGRRFPLVIAPFNVLLHLYERTDVENFLARVRGHLAARGELVMDLSMPMPEDLSRDPMRAHHAPRFRHPTEGVVRYREFFDYDRARQILFVAMEMTPANGKTIAVPLAHRQFFPREWEALLHYNGFEIERAHGDFVGGALESGSDMMVIHARARRRA